MTVFLTGRSFMRFQNYPLKMCWSCCKSNYICWPVYARMAGWITQTIVLNHHAFYAYIFAGLSAARIERLEWVHRPVALLMVGFAKTKLILYRIVYAYTMRIAYCIELYMREIFYTGFHSNCASHTPQVHHVDSGGGYTLGHPPTWVSFSVRALRPTVIRRSHLPDLW